jgi:sugar/nucleoside kinase (ribokinase family)
LNYLNTSQPKPHSTARICAIGELLLELLPETPDVLFEEYGRMIKSPSGAAGIFACAAAALDAEVSLICRLGTDGFSRFALKAVEQYGVDTSQVTIDPERQIGLAFVEHSQQRNFIYYRKNSAGSTLSPEHVVTEHVAKYQAVHFPAMLLDISASMRDACLKLLQISKEQGLLVSIDPNIRRELKKNNSDDLLQQVLTQADILTPSEEEALLITGKTTVDEAAAALLALGPQVVAVTCGVQGAVVYSADEKVVIPEYPVQPLDNVGAGDVFAAAFLVGLLEGMSLTAAGNFANTAAALKVKKQGGIGRGLPTRQEVEQALAKVPAKQAMGI